MYKYKKEVAISMKKATSSLKRVSEMLEDNKYCIDIIQQSLAVIGLLKGANKKLLEGHLNACYKKSLTSKNSKKQQEMIDELIKIMDLAQRK